MGVAATAAAALLLFVAFGAHAAISSFTLMGESGMHSSEREGLAKSSRDPPPETDNQNLIGRRGLLWNDDPNNVVATRRRRDAWRKSFDEEDAIRRLRLGPEYKRMRDAQGRYLKAEPRQRTSTGSASAEGDPKFPPLLLPLDSPSKPRTFISHQDPINSQRSHTLNPRDPTPLLPSNSPRPRILTREGLPHQPGGRFAWKRQSESSSRQRARDSSKSQRLKEYQGSTAADKARKAALSRSFPSSPLFRPAPSLLPTYEDSITFKRRLQDKCQRPESGKMPYPNRISVSGLPNTGTNAMVSQLKARLDIRVSNGPARGIWKHIMPFHPEMERILTVNCSHWAPDWDAQLFMVRHPLTWIRAQTTRGTNFGSRCYGQSCTFDACQPRPCKSGYDDPKSHKPPHTYIFPTLLDLWAAHATHVPTNGLPNALAVRYEDLLEDPEAVVQRVAEHFGVRLKAVNGTEDDPLASNARAWLGDKKGASHREKSLQKWQNYKHFWTQRGIGVMSGGTGSDEQVGGPGPVVGCVAIPKMDRTNIRALQTIQNDRPEILERALEMHGYQVPTANQTMAPCALKVQVVR